MNDLVILVNEQDQEIGTMPKLEAHQKGLLHRAFSVFIFNTQGELLLQQRAFDKYHSAGLWSNTCCSHPYIDENILTAANRRLHEEMGIATDLQEIHSFIYHEALDNDLIEHEFDHVLIGMTDDMPKINTNEVADFQYISLENLQIDMELNPEKYTVWFKICLTSVAEKFRSSNYFKNIVS